MVSQNGYLVVVSARAAYSHSASLKSQIVFADIFGEPRHILAHTVHTRAYCTSLLAEARPPPRRNRLSGGEIVGVGWATRPRCGVANQTEGIHPGSSTHIWCLSIAKLREVT